MEQKDRKKNKNPREATKTGDKAAENIEFLPITDLKPYENNARLHPKDQLEKISKSIKEFGFITPVIIDENNTILVGHGRTEAAKMAGMSAVPCRRVSDLTDEQKRAYILADNKLSDLAEWDEELLQMELDRIECLDMSDFGFEEFEVEIEEPETHETEIPEAEETGIQEGDVFRLGRHRLLCGDSTDFLAVRELMDGAKADLVFTDPPYGMKKESEGVLNDNLNFDDLLEFNKKWLACAFDVLKENGSLYCWGTDEPLMDIYSNILKPMIKTNQITFRNLITWDKGTGIGQLSEEMRMYSPATEKCLFLMTGVQGFNTNADNYFKKYEPVRAYFEREIKKLKESDKQIANALGYKDGRTVNHWYAKSQWNFPTDENMEKLAEYGKQKGIEIINKREYEQIKREYEQIKRGYEQIKREWYETRAYFNNTHDNMNDVWHFERTSTEERETTGGHATPKPIALCSRAIKTSSKEGEIVLDLFGGSGSTLIAAEMLNRTCYMMELEPKYVGVIIKRWETLTGGKAERI